MKLTIVVLSLPGVLACLHLTGSFTHRPGNNFDSLNIQVFDNGAIVCDSARGTQAHNKDNPPQISLTCNASYGYSTDSSLSWYNNIGGGSWRVDNKATLGNFICAGHQQCVTYKWDATMFGC